MRRLTVEEGIGTFQRTHIKPSRQRFLELKNGEPHGVLIAVLAAEQRGWDEVRKIRDAQIAGIATTADPHHDWVMTTGPALGSLIGLDGSYTIGLDVGFRFGHKGSAYRDEIVARDIALVPDPARFTEGVEDGHAIALAVFDTAVAAEAQT